jgi:predicted DCC family thiol-disulfide oxidoreductase YuxK
MNNPILLFDGVCNLCNSTVQWILARDKKAQFRFAALQSEIGQALLIQHGIDTQSIDSVILIDGDRVFIKSDAALEVATRIGGAWTLMGIFYIIPRPIRNIVYDWIARNRYRWFGKHNECWLPRPEWKARFL